MYEQAVTVSDSIPDRIAGKTSDYRVVGVYPGEYSPRFFVLGRTAGEAWRAARRHRLAYAWLQHWVGTQGRGHWEGEMTPVVKQFEQRRKASISSSASSLLRVFKGHPGLIVRCDIDRIVVSANEDASDDDKTLAKRLLRDKGWEGWLVVFEGFGS